MERNFKQSETQTQHDKV